MPDTRRVLSIKPSWRHQQILLLGHIALLVCVWPLLFGFYWTLWLVGWVASLGWALWQARCRHMMLEWHGETLYYQHQHYTLGVGSRIAIGCLWLDLHGPRTRRLWIFADSLTDEAYRFVARQITLHSSC